MSTSKIYLFGSLGSATREHFAGRDLHTSLPQVESLLALLSSSTPHSITLTQTVNSYPDALTLSHCILHRHSFLALQFHTCHIKLSVCGINGHYYLGVSPDGLMYLRCNGIRDSADFYTSFDEANFALMSRQWCQNMDLPEE